MIDKNEKIGEILTGCVRRRLVLKRRRLAEADGSNNMNVRLKMNCDDETNFRSSVSVSRVTSSTVMSFGWAWIGSMSWVKVQSNQILGFLIAVKNNEKKKSI